MGPHVVVMGVAGCGKSAVGRRLAAQLGLTLIEGDDFHSAANLAKMKRGLPLNDEDRADWLQALGRQLASQSAGVLSCSALKRAYRDTLRAAVPDARFVHLAITQTEALRRVSLRADHFYPPSLVASQFEALQAPHGAPHSEPYALTLDGSADLDELARQAVQWLRSELSAQAARG